MRLTSAMNPTGSAAGSTDPKSPSLGSRLEPHNRCSDKGSACLVPYSWAASGSIGSELSGAIPRDSLNL